ncbi:MAG: helix-turn-helix domain-containing protein [Candidatus Aminicenantes bacterium]|jgi:transcriptional regulator with GAF, ATPase, and Fis domain
MNETIETNKHMVRDQQPPLPQMDIQVPAESDSSKRLGTDYLEEWKERAFKKEILSLFIDYYCVKRQVSLKEIMQDIEKTLLVRILVQFNGNQKKAAKFLKTRSTTLNEKVKRYNIRFQKKPA